MKKKNKEKLQLKREQERIKRQEEQRIKNSQIIRQISAEQINNLKQFNISTFSDNEISKEKMLETLEELLNIIVKSSYLDEVTRMTRMNVSNEWFDRDVDKDFISEILGKELENAKNAPTESIALKICYWSNRIAHHLEKEVFGKETSVKMNGLYSKYFLNPKYTYDALLTRERLKEGKYSEGNPILKEILRKEIGKFEEIETISQLNDVFLGINIRNELWTIKQQMIKLILLSISKNKNSSIKVTSVNEKKECSIGGNESLRLIIREINGIAPVVMHCNKEKINEYLKSKDLSLIPEETDKNLIRFARRGKIGIHFVLDKEGCDILDYEAGERITAKRLNNILYRGETEDER